MKKVEINTPIVWDTALGRVMRKEILEMSPEVLEASVKLWMEAGIPENLINQMVADCNLKTSEHHTVMPSTSSPAMKREAWIFSLRYPGDND